MRFFRHHSKRSQRGLLEQGRLIVLGLLLFLVALIIGFGSGFPTDALRERLLSELGRQTGLSVSSNRLELGAPAEVRFDLTVDPHHPQFAPLVFPQLQLRPLWTSLFGRNRAAKLQGSFAAGEITAVISSDDHLQLELQGVQLMQLQQAQNPYRLDGVLQGELDGRQLSQAGRADALFSAEIRDLAVLGLEQFALPDPLALGQLAAKGRLRGHRLNVEQLALNGDVAVLSGNGTIQLGENPQRTRLNLRVQATPGPAFPDSLKPLIELSGVKPRPDGSYQFRIAGTLARPILR